MHGGGPTDNHLEVVIISLAAATPIHGPADRPEKDPWLDDISPATIRKAITSGGSGIGADGWRRDELRALPEFAFAPLASILDAI